MTETNNTEGDCTLYLLYIIYKIKLQAQSYTYFYLYSDIQVEVSPCPGIHINISALDVNPKAIWAFRVVDRVPTFFDSLHQNAKKTLKDQRGCSLKLKLMLMV
jgi:hypothetical protein